MSTLTSPPLSSPRHQKGEQGIAIIMTALLLIPLMVFAAYGVDLASWYSRISYLQKSADAASLAGTVWMPQLSQARSVACSSLKRNGIGSGSGTCDTDPVVGNVTISIGIGSTNNSLKVSLTDTNATRYFSQVLGRTQALTRSAEAQYNLPIPLGSPLNYFGGNELKNTFARTTTPATNVVDWPPNWNNVANPPTNAACNVGGTNINLGRWINSTTFDPAAINSGSTQCRWTNDGDPALPTPTSVPPPDYFRRGPTNAPCNVFQSNAGVNGRWTDPVTWDSASRYNSGAGNVQCTWDALITRVSSFLPFMQNSPNNVAANQPSNRPCNVGYDAAYGNWSATSGSGWNNTGMLPAGATVKTAANGNQLCEWVPRITSTPAITTSVPTGNQIDPLRSPGFWAMVEGPGTVNPNGDAFSPRCYTTLDCASTENANFVPTTDPNRGYWYVVKIPTGLSGSVALQVYDGQFGGNAVKTTAPANCSQSNTSQVDCTSSLSNMTGDNELNVSTASFQTEYKVYRQTNPFDYQVRTPLATIAAGNTSENSCWWALAEHPFFRLQWRTLCTLTGVAAGDLFLINVRTNDITGSSGSGLNGYALQACANGSCTAGTQPALYAYNNMGMFNNFTAGGTSPQTATFYLAEVGPQYAGKTLVVELWDPGDSSGASTIFPMKPSASLPGPVVNVPATDCSYKADPNPNVAQTTSPGGATGRLETVAHASDTTPSCGIVTHNGSSSQFNGTWLRMNIKVPTAYTCTLGINPVTTANSCWWGIQYQFAAATTDVTTWTARIEGNPVHLTR